MAGAAQYWDPTTYAYTAPTNGPVDAKTAVVEFFLDKGYNSNYATSWFLVRGAPQLQSDGANGLECAAGTLVKSLHGSTGPISRSKVESSFHSASIIPFVFDANVGDTNEAALREDLGKYGKKGDRTCESFSDGPAQNDTSALMTGWLKWGRTGVDVPVISLASPAFNVYAEEQPKPGQVLPPEHPRNLQDYRDMAPVHAGQVNVLFADGSIRAFKDLNADGYLNPGFNIDPTADHSAIGYKDGKVELPPETVFSGIFIEKQTDKGKLD
jgi:prepilin-type processing-associated H-X9-DG protein